MLYQILLAAHSGFRWVVLATMIITIVRYFGKWQKDQQYFKADKLWFSLSVSFLHLQFLGGLILYFVSPKVHFSEATMTTKVFRFFTVEHAILMILAVVLITIGSAKIKRTPESVKKFKKGFWYLVVTLIIIIAGIPWPFYGIGGGWF